MLLKDRILYILLALAANVAMTFAASYAPKETRYFAMAVCALFVAYMAFRLAAWFVRGFLRFRHDVWHRRFVRNPRKEEVPQCSRS